MKTDYPDFFIFLQFPSLDWAKAKKKSAPKKYRNQSRATKEPIKGVEIGKKELSGSESWKGRGKKLSSNAAAAATLHG